jgi:hypothetical protein
MTFSRRRGHVWWRVVKRADDLQSLELALGLALCTVLLHEAGHVHLFRQFAWRGVK